MADAKSKGIRYVTGSVLAFGALLAAATNPGCGSESTNMSSESSSSSSGASSSSGMGGSNGCNTGPFGNQLSPGANGGFTDAFDATPNAMGSAVYFTAVDMSDNPGVFRQDICAAGAAVPVFTGAPFEAPFSIAISSDDKLLFVADPSAAEGPTTDKGILFSLAAAGGATPTTLVASVSPRGVTVFPDTTNGDQVYFTGIDKATKLAGVFKVAAAGGGTVTTIAAGPPFIDPGGVAVASNGDVYVVDTDGSGSRLGNIIVVKAGVATEFVPNLQVGYPAGITLTKDDTTILVSGLDPTAQSDVVFQVEVATKAVTSNTFGSINAFAEAAGLHRAHKVDVFAWADSKATPAGMAGTGTVFVIK